MSDNGGEWVERRRSFRLDMEKELVDIAWTDENGQEHTRKIACLDFARGGLKLDCDVPLPINTAVTIVFKAASNTNQKLYGQVLRCIKQDNGWYEVAVRFNNDN